LFIFFIINITSIYYLLDFQYFNELIDLRLYIFYILFLILINNANNKNY